MNKLLLLAGSALLATSTAQAGPLAKLPNGSLPRLAPVASNLTPKLPIIPVVDLPQLPGLPNVCDGSAASCLPRVPEIPAIGVPGWVDQNAQQYRVYSTRVLVPYLQTWAGQPHAANVRRGAADAADDVVIVTACDRACAPTLNPKGVPSAISKLAQVGKGIIPAPPGPPSPVMPGGR